MRSEYKDFRFNPFVQFKDLLDLLKHLHIQSMDFSIEYVCQLRLSSLRLWCINNEWIVSGELSASQAWLNK